MTETVRTALLMMSDPALCTKDWSQVFEDQKLDPNDDVDGDTFCAVMYTNWVYARMAHLILSGDDAELAKHIERADPQRLIRKRLTVLQ